MNAENAKLRIKRELVDKYIHLAEEKGLGKYNEEQTKKDFILPLFEILGWNVYNDLNKNDTVLAEERVSKKRVDYGFKINGIPKFYLEAKPISSNLNKTVFVEQAINYSWHKGCTWAVLTNFEGIKVFNAEWKSKNVNDNLFLNLNWSDYIERFDKLWLLSKESFEIGLLDKEAEIFGKKSKKIPVDKQLLADFTRLREILSKDITKLNQDCGLTEEELDESVQRILDRLIFIRNCEDRELEAQKLMPALRVKDWGSIEKKGHLLNLLRAIFKYFDGQYNSKLFQEHLCDTLDISDTVLIEVISGLYRTKDETVYYDYSAIEADVLGNIYEQYLGHILRKTAKRAKVTENHSKRKEHGIYYTPPYIVDYIVRNTLGELLKRKTPKDVEKIRVLDPACGSGSFLIKAFDVLNEYWKKKDKDYAQSKIDTSGYGVTYTRKVNILGNNIFGVDLDKQAVEIAQLNLLLKIAEKGHRLPLLQQNIKCGNSLIDNPEVAGDKAFRWEEEFKQIMDEDGFDVVIGNPPYVRQEELGKFKPYFKTHYESYKGTADLLVYFFEQSINILKEGGYFGFIASNKFIRSDYGANLRRYILKQCSIEKVIDFGELPVFRDASTFPCIFVYKKHKAKKNHKLRFCAVQTLDFGNPVNYVAEHGYEVKQSDLRDGAWQLLPSNVSSIIEKMDRQGIPLKKYAPHPLRGILTGFNEAFVLDEKTKNKLIEKDQKNKEIIFPTLRGRDITRYGIKDQNLWMIVTRNGIDVPKSYPTIFEYLSHYRDKLDKRVDKGEYWYNLRACKYYDKFEETKIIYGDISLQNRFTLDSDGYYPLKTCFIIPKADKYLLALLNSTLFKFYMRQKFPILGDSSKGGRILHGTTYMNNLPIKVGDSVEQQSIVNLVDKILSLNKQLNEIGDKRTDERAKIEEKIRKTDTEIDELVYALYNITEKEKKLLM